MPLVDGAGLTRGVTLSPTTTLAQPSELVEDVRVGGGLSPLPLSE